MKINLSVIIPIYNTEKYLKRCLDSVINQTYKIFEIICINDGSTDKSLDILKQYQKIDDRIKIINQKNKGVSSARNKGLEIAKGKYIGFVDSDDYIDKDMFKNLMEKAINHNLDVCGCNYYEVFNNKLKRSKYKYNNNILNKSDILNYLNKHKFSPVIWDKIYKKETISNIKFNQKLLFNEDALFNVEVFLKANSISFIDKPLYYYTQNNNSLIHRYFCKDIVKYNYISFVDRILDEKYLYYYELKKIHLFSNALDKKNRYKYLKKYINKNYLKKLLKENIKFYSKFEIIIFLINIRLHLVLFNLYKFLREK